MDISNSYLEILQIVFCMAIIVLNFIIMFSLKLDDILVIFINLHTGQKLSICRKLYS